MQTVSDQFKVVQRRIFEAVDRYECVLLESKRILAGVLAIFNLSDRYMAESFDMRFIRNSYLVIDALKTGAARPLSIT
jgi:hypothetical protein